MYNVVIERKFDGKLVSEYLKKSSEQTIIHDAKKLAKNWTDKSGHEWRVKSYKRLQ